MTFLTSRTGNAAKRVRRTFNRVAHSAAGAIDLVSIMVGVLVIGVIGGVISATVFGVIPWSQDKAAQQDLGAVHTAESVAQMQDSKFSDMAGLISAHRTQAKSSVVATTNSAGTCCIAAARSATGNTYITDDTSPAVTLYVAGATSTCADVGGLVASIPGPAPVASAPVDPLVACRTTVDPAAGMVGTAADLTTAFAGGGSIALNSDIAMSSLSAPVNKTTVLDLNGHNHLTDTTQKPLPQ